jgi:DNA-binding transcriptional ArsR family regulator
MPSPGRKRLPKSMEVALDKPFEGLFGDTAELRVLQEIVADPYSDYSHHDLMELTDLSDPSVRRGIMVLIDHGIIRNVSSVRRSPLYRANLDSKKLTALTFLSYASLDERTGSTSMDDAVRHYCGPRGAYVDFLEMPGVKKDGRVMVKGTRVYMSHVIAKRLGEVLQEVLKKAGREGGLEKLRVSP